MILKEYIKKILENKVFENIKLTPQLIEVMMDYSFEKDEPVIYKNKYKDIHIWFSDDEPEPRTATVYVDYIEEPVNIPVIVYDNVQTIKGNETKEKFIEKAYSVVKEFYNIAKLDELFQQEMDKRRFESNKENYQKKGSSALWRKKIKRNNILVFFSLHNPEDRIVSMLNGIEFSSFNINEPGGRWLHEPDEIMEKLKNMLDKIEKLIEEDEENWVVFPD